MNCSSRELPDSSFSIRPKIDLSTVNQLADHRRIRKALRRLCKGNGRAAQAAGTAPGPTFGYHTTVREIARAVNLEPQLVADHLEDAWLVILEKNTSLPVELWRVSEDGE